MADTACMRGLCSTLCKGLLVLSSVMGSAGMAFANDLTLINANQVADFGNVRHISNLSGLGYHPRFTYNSAGKGLNLHGQHLSPTDSRLGWQFDGAFMGYVAVDNNNSAVETYFGVAPFRTLDPSTVHASSILNDSEDEDPDARSAYESVLFFQVTVKLKNY